MITHNDAPHSVGLLWTSDQPDAKNLYLTTHNTHDRQTSMPLAEFEPTIPPSERLQTHGLLQSQSHFVSPEALVVNDKFKIIQKLATLAC
jgi:hypothetical protein